MMKRKGGRESQEKKSKELEVHSHFVGSSALEYMEQHRVDRIAIKTTLACPESSELLHKMAVHDRLSGHVDSFYFYEYHCDSKLLPTIPKTISVVDDNLEIELYLFKKSDTFDFKIEAILARNPKSQHNVLHWIIEEFIQTQKRSRAGIPEHTDCYCYITKHRHAIVRVVRKEISDLKSIDFKIWDEAVIERFTSSHFGVPTKFNLKPLRSVLLYKDEKLDLDDIIFKGTDLYDKLVENVDKDTAYKLLISQDNQGNTPLHLLPEIIKDIKAGEQIKSQHAEFFEHLLKYISSNLTDEMKVKLICIQNNDGNNILHLLKDNLEEHWHQVFDAFGNNAFIRATFQLNDDGKRALEIANHFPTELLTVLWESGGTTDVIDVSPTQEEESKNEENEEMSSVIPVSYNNIRSNPPSQQQKRPKIFLDGIKKHLAREGEPISSDTLMSWHLSEDDLLSEFSDGSTIFGTIIAIQPLQLTSYCIENILSSTQHHQGSSIYLLAIKQRLARDGEPISRYTLMSLHLSEDDLLSELSDGSTIFGTIIANQPLELITYCIENILSSTQHQQILFSYLFGIKDRLYQENTPILINTLTSLKLSEDHLLTKHSGSTIFVDIFAKQSLELIGHCIDSILSPWKLYDYYQRNSQQVNASIAQNPNISLPEWMMLYNRKTISIQLFCYLSERRSNIMSLLARRSEDYEERKEAFFTLIIQIYEHTFELDQPNTHFCRGSTAEYYMLHLCLYNLAQAMTAAERKETFCDCFSTYAAEFADCDLNLTIEILACLGLDPETHLEKAAPNKSSYCDPKLSEFNKSHTEPSAPPPPSSYSNETVVTATVMTSPNDINLPEGTVTSIFSPSNEEEEGEEKEEKEYEKHEKHENCVLM